MSIRKTLFIVCCLWLTLGARQANPSAEFLYVLYVQSISNPETFDAFVAENREFVNEGFWMHLEVVYTRWERQASKVLDQCQNLGTQQQTSACFNENPAADLFLWATSMIPVLNEEQTWLETQRGQELMVVKSLFKDSGIDYQTLINVGLKSNESELRKLFR